MIQFAFSEIPKLISGAKFAKLNTKKPKAGQQASTQNKLREIATEVQK